MIAFWSWDSEFYHGEKNSQLLSSGCRDLKISGLKCKLYPAQRASPSPWGTQSNAAQRATGNGGDGVARGDLVNVADYNNVVT